MRAKSFESMAIAMRGELRRDVALDGLQLVGRFRRGQVEEQALEAMEVFPALVERRDRIAEARRVGALGDGFDLGPVRVHPVQERREIMFRLEAVERRQAVRCLPRLQQRILVVIGHGLEEREEKDRHYLRPARKRTNGASRASPRPSR
jgi:hypothetical protein